MTRHTIPSKTPKPDMTLTRAKQEELKKTRQTKEANPIPTPQEGETEVNFVSRCMGTDTMITEFPEQDRRAAICHDSFRSKDVVKESFQWAQPIDMNYVNGRGEHLIRGVGLTVGTSRNMTKYQRGELLRAARSLKGKPLYVNHNRNRKVGFVYDAEFEDEQLEYQAIVTDDLIWKKILNKEITHVSPLGVPRSWHRTPEQKLLHRRGIRAGTPLGITFDELSLVVPPSKAGDLDTSIVAMECFLETCLFKTKEEAQFREPSNIETGTLESQLEKLLPKHPECPDGKYYDGQTFVNLPKDITVLEKAMLQNRLMMQVFQEVKDRTVSHETDGSDLDEMADNRVKIMETVARIEKLEQKKTHHTHITPRNLHIRDFMRLKKKPKRKSEDEASETLKPEESGQIGIVLAPSKTSKKTTINPKKLRLKDFIDKTKHPPIHRHT